MTAEGRPPRRILMVTWEYPPRIIGGIARHADELSRALAHTGMEVDVLTAFHPGAPAEETIPVGEGQVRVLRAGPSPLLALDFINDIHQLNFGLLERLLSDGDVHYDLVHAHDWLVTFAARVLRHGRGRPLVATIHATEAGRNGGLHSPLQHYIHSIEWLLTYDAWRVVCCTEAMRAEVEGGLRVPGDKIRVIPNGIDPDRVACSDSPAQLKVFRREWASPEERIVLFVGRLVAEKGATVLLDAVPAVLAAQPNTKFVIAGEGGLRDTLARLVAERGLAAKVALPGFVPEGDLPRLYAVADVAVFPSLYEPFGIVALEAMAAGVPAVTSDAGGFAEVVHHLQTGVLTRAGDPGSLAWGVGLVLSDPALAARLRKEGRREARGRFGWRRIAARTRELYTEVLESQVATGDRRALPEAGPGVRARYLSGRPEDRS